MHIDMVVTVLCNYTLVLLQNFKSLVDIFKSKLFFSPTLITLLVFFLVVVLLLSKWINFPHTWDGTTNAGIEHTMLDGMRLLLLLVLPTFSICRSMIFHTKSTETTSCILRPKLGPKLIERPHLVSSKKKRSAFGRPWLYGSLSRSLFVPVMLLFLSYMPLNVDALFEVAFVKMHVRLLRLRELPNKNGFAKNSTNTSNDVFQPFHLQQPHTDSTIPANPILLHHNKSNVISSRPRFIRNGIVNKWFNDVNSASRQQEKFEAFRSGLKNGKHVKSEMIKCIEMYLGFLAMGCFIAYMGVNVIPWVTLDIYFYFRKRRNEKKL